MAAFSKLSLERNKNMRELKTITDDGTSAYEDGENGFVKNCNASQDVFVLNTSQLGTDATTFYCPVIRKPVGITAGPICRESSCSHHIAF